MGLTWVGVLVGLSSVLKHAVRSAKGGDVTGEIRRVFH